MSIHFLLHMVNNNLPCTFDTHQYYIDNYRPGESTTYEYIQDPGRGKPARSQPNEIPASIATQTPMFLTCLKHALTMCLHQTSLQLQHRN